MLEGGPLPMVLASAAAIDVAIKAAIIESTRAVCFIVALLLFYSYMLTLIPPTCSALGDGTRPPGQPLVHGCEAGIGTTQAGRGEPRRRFNGLSQSRCSATSFIGLDSVRTGDKCRVLGPTTGLLVRRSKDWSPMTARVIASRLRHARPLSRSYCLDLIGGARP